MPESVMHDTDAALAKAAAAEIKFLETRNDKDKHRANLYFKRAMKNDGNPDFNEDMI